MILRNLISLRVFTVYMENSLQFEIFKLTEQTDCQIDRSEICTEVIFTSPEFMRTLIMKLPYNEVKFYPRSEISNRFEFTSGLM